MTSEQVGGFAILAASVALVPDASSLFQNVIYPYMAAAAGAYMGVFLHSKDTLGTTNRVHLFLIGLFSAMFTGPVLKDVFLADQPQSVAVFINWAISASALGVLPILIRRVKKTASTAGPDFIEKDDANG